MTHDNPSLQDVGVVVIGRNEGERLRRCLDALTSHPGPVVYVDSASSDDSVAYAQAQGVDVVELDASLPLNAARARNAGFARLTQTAPEMRFVQFLDGDCELLTNWLPAARDDLHRNADHGIVTGHLRERDPRATPYQTICDVEWRGPVGELPCCGGIFMIRTEHFHNVGGFDQTIIAAEDDDFCFRVRRLGLKVVRLDRGMALHDAAMTRIGQWWRRAVRSGHALAQTAALHASWRHPSGFRRIAGTWAWTVGLPAIAGLATWRLGGWALLMLLAYPGLLWRIVRHTMRQGNDLYASCLYSLHCLAGKAPQCCGQLVFLFNSLRGRQSTLIEHKSAPRMNDVPGK